MSPVNAPDAPGRLGEAVDPLQLRSYLIALDKWLEARRSELEALDVAVQESEHADELTRDMALSLQLWQSIQTRYRRLLQVWDRGRVSIREREQLSSLVWGRLDDDTWSGTAASGLSLPEACRMSDALCGQLRSRLQLDPAGTQAVAVVIFGHHGTAARPGRPGTATDHRRRPGRLAQLEGRLTMINEGRARRNIGRLLGPLEAERRRSSATSSAACSALMPGPATDRPARRLRATVARRPAGPQPAVGRAGRPGGATIGSPPKYAVPDHSVGPVPAGNPGSGGLHRAAREGRAGDGVRLSRLFGRAARIAEARERVDHAALGGRSASADRSTAERCCHRRSADAAFAAPTETLTAAGRLPHTSAGWSARHTVVD